MATATIVSGLDRLLSADVYAKLLSAAAEQGRPLDELVRAAIEDYLDAPDEPEYEDTPDEKILADFKQAFQEVLNGTAELIPARQALEEIRRELEAETQQDDYAGES